MGYPVELHQIVTTDGYQIALHRIPKTNSTLRPLLLVHGLCVSGSMYIAKIPDIEKSLAYLLSDAGYDMWILHSRGTHLSMNHKILTIDDKKFWDFSQHEIGIYDVTAAIDYVLEKTGADKLHYSGVSQGTTVFLIALSMRPEYNEKVASSYLMAPVGSLANIGGFVKFIIDTQLAAFQIDTFKGMNVFYFPLKHELVRQVIESFCDDPIRSTLCQAVTEMVIGPFNPLIKVDKVIIQLVRYFFDNASLKLFEHYYQISKSKKFQQFDYGVSGNYERYKRKTPPEYNLSMIEVPVTLMSAKNDFLATHEVMN